MKCERCEEYEQWEEYGADTFLFVPSVLFELFALLSPANFGLTLAPFPT